MGTPAPAEAGESPPRWPPQLAQPTPAWLNVPSLDTSPSSLQMCVLVLSGCFSAAQGFSRLNHRSWLPKCVDMSVGFEQPIRLF